MGSHAPLSDISEDKFVEFETVVMPIPQFDTENPQMISQGPSVCVFNKEDPQEVLASWLFTQYLLTNEVQIAYAGTEGYVPVTSKAQDSSEYQDYMSRGGEDNNKYYDIKIQASQLLLDKRLAQAQMLLHSTDLPVGEIAQRVCMGSENYFYAVFKKRFGTSPLQYRKRQRSI